MKVNRIWLTVGVILIASAFYEARVKPQSRPLYERALALYNQGNYQESQVELERAYQIEPNSTAIMVLKGWNHLKMRQYEAARGNFSRAARINPRLVEAKLGLVYLDLESGQGRVRLEEIRSLLNQEPGNKDFRLAAATALHQAGENRESAAIFRGLLGRDKYGELARKNLEEMYGLERLNEEIPSDLPPRVRPNGLRVDFRAYGQFFQRRNGNSWENFYVKGINLSPGTPGHFASDPPTLVESYLQWLQQISELGANTIRTYSLLPPAFYRALQRHNENPNRSPLYLLQQIWLVGPEDTNLFVPKVGIASREEIAWVIDAIHGHGDVPMRRGHANGLYDVDVSPYVLGYLIGRELEPHLVQANNGENSERKSYAGKYVSIAEGNATEVWLTSMMDYAANYEVEIYNQQHPLAFVNWPPLDPLSHPTEAGLLEEISIRRQLGERTAAVPANEVIDDNDAASLDAARIQVRPEFPSGIFASYSAFPFYPDFLYREASYLSVRGSQGPNPFFGYLKELQGYYYRRLPMLVSDYGMSTSLGVSHLHPLGGNQGGLTEREQGEWLARMTRNIYDAGFAGGLIYNWQDEWHRANWLTAPLAMPYDRRPLWNNKLDPDQGFGLWTYHSPADSQLFSAFSGWDTVPPLYQKAEGTTTTLQDGWDSERTLRSLSASSDPAFLYLRLQVDKVRQGPNGVPDLKGANYYLGINALPGKLGGQVLPGLTPEVSSQSGVGFLLHIADGGNARLLIASNYDPREMRPTSDGSPYSRLTYRVPLVPTVTNWSGFEEILVETNPRRFARDGRMFPPQRYNYTPLRYRPAGNSEDTLATWTCDFTKNAFVFRIPWALLMVMDPTSHQVLAGIGAEARLVSAETSGLQLLAVSFRPGDPIQLHQPPLRGVPAVNSLPSRNSQGELTGLRSYRWPAWDLASLQGRRKASYAIVQRAFRELR